MLIAALILVLSVGATVQFAVLSWHAGVLRTASQALSNATVTDLKLRPITADAASFKQAVAYSQLCPDLGSDAGAPLTAVRLYHLCLSGFDAIRAKLLPSNANGENGWASREITLCTQYAQVALAQRVEHNRAIFSQAASF